MTTRSNTAEGASGAVPLTGGSGGNTGGISGDFANTVSSGTGTTQAFDNSRSMHGTWSYTFATGSTSASASFNWTGIAGMALCTGRCYVNTSAFAGLGSLVRLRGSTVQTARIAISATGQIQIRDTANGLITATTHILTANSWARIEWAINIGASAAADVWLYLTPDAPIGSHTETLHVTAQNFGTNNVDEAGFGFPSAVANGSQIWMDDFWVSDAGVPGPSQLWTPQPSVFVLPMPLYRQPGFVLIAAPQAIVVPAAASPEPIVVLPAYTPAQQLPSPVLLRSSLADTAVPPAPAPLIISSPASWPLTPHAVTLRSSIQDFATPPTPRPLIVTPPHIPALRYTALTIRSPQQDFATPTTPQPLVSAWQPHHTMPPAAAVLRSSLMDADALTTTTRSPLVVAAAYPVPAPAPPVLLRPPAHSCTTPRPSTGTTVYDRTTTARPGSGTTSRPSIGITPRPNTGVTVQPC